MSAPRVRELTPLLGALLASVVVHGSILDLSFYRDDFVHLFRAANFGLPDFLRQTYGGHLLTVTNAFFSAEYALFGADPTGWFAVILAVHLLNVALLYGVMRRCGVSAGWAGIVAAIWGMSPQHRGTIGWISVFGQTLATAFLLTLMWDAARVRSRGAHPTCRQCALWLGLLCGCALSFGVGLAVAATAPVWLALLVPGIRERPATWAGFTALLFVVPVGYLLLLQLDPALPSLASAPLGIVGSPTFIGWYQWTRALPDLLAHGVAAVLLGSVVVVDGTEMASGSGGSLGTIVWISRVAAGVVAVAVCFAVARSPIADAAAAFGLTAVVIYAVIAAARVPFWVATQTDLASAITTPRYHYTATACLALAIGVGLGRLKRMAFGRAALGVAVALLAVSILPNRESASRFSYPDRELGDQQWTQAVEVLDTRIRESPPGAGVRIRNLAFPPMGGRLGEEFPGLAGIFIIAWPTNVVDGHRVRFLDQNAARLAFAARHPDTRIHELLVPANPQGVSPGTK